MSRFAITSLGPAEKLGGAMIPLPAGRSYAMLSRGMINGSPGTEAIAAPRPPLPYGDDTSRAILGGWHQSQQAPAFWYPGVYYQTNATDPPEKCPVSVYSDTQMPMPAIDPRGNPSVSMERPRLGGQYQVRNRASVPAYPPMGSA